MVDQDYKRARATAAKELEQLLANQKLTEQRINHLRSTIAILDKLAGVSQTKKLKLTDSIRSIFKAVPSDTRLGPTGVRDKLLEMGLDEGDYSNLLASVHVVLRRLAQNGEITSSPSGRYGPKAPEDFLAEL